MKTILYLIRHGATEEKVRRQGLQGRQANPPLARLGVRQAEATRDVLAIRPVDACYCSPLQRAVQTATIVALPHGLSPVPLESLTECRDQGHRGGESFAGVYQRVHEAIEELLVLHSGQAILVVGHDIVNRTYLTGLLGLSLGQADQVRLDNCGISVIAREKGITAVSTLNAVFHLQGLAA
jgi:broad specificity phosphatase PhoE